MLLAAIATEIREARTGGIDFKCNAYTSKDTNRTSYTLNIKNSTGNKILEIESDFDEIKISKWE